MALANKCDRCGKLYECYPIGNRPGIYNAVKRVRKRADGRLDFEEQSKDLCPKCMEKLNAFLKGEQQC